MSQDFIDDRQMAQILQQHGVKLKKSLGQNFLRDADVLDDIVQAADVSKQDDVIEIGPGSGALTQHLALAAHQVLSFEIDQRLIPVLNETLRDFQNVTIVNEDILKANLPQLVSETFDGKHQLKVVANLPYYITTPIMMHLIESDLPIETMVLMVQKEVAERITSENGSKDYGSLSIAVQVKMHAKIAEIVPKKAFLPPPKVDSAIIVLTKRQTPLVADDHYAVFDKVVRACFAQRRKTMSNNLLNWLGKTPENKEKLAAIYSELDLKPSVRAEQLTIDQFKHLSELIETEFQPN